MRASNAITSIAPPWVSGRYYFCPNTTSTTTGVATNNRLRAVPFFVPGPVTISRIGAEVTAIGEAGSKVRLGIYADNGTGMPGQLVVDAGQIAGDSATVQELTVSAAIGPGWYWAAGACQSAPTTPPTCRVTGNASYGVLIAYATSVPGTNAAATGLYVDSVSGALPTTFSAGFPFASGNAFRIFVKVA